MSYCETQEFAFKKMGVEFQSYVILKRLKLEVSAWSRFVEFLKLFKMLMDLKWKICVVFSQSWKTKRPVFFLATVITEKPSAVTILALNVSLPVSRVTPDACRKVPARGRLT